VRVRAVLKTGAGGRGARRSAPHYFLLWGASKRVWSSTTSQLGLFWPAGFRPIPQKDSTWDAYTAKETENRQGEVGFLRYSPYGP
jgi:hypothetical protein